VAGEKGAVWFGLVCERVGAPETEGLKRARGGVFWRLGFRPSQMRVEGESVVDGRWFEPPPLAV
jgi:hypothetical protein